MSKLLGEAAKKLPHVILGVWYHAAAAVRTQCGLACCSLTAYAWWNYTHIPLSDYILNPKSHKTPLFSHTISSLTKSFTWSEVTKSAVSFSSALSQQERWLTCTLDSFIVLISTMIAVRGLVHCTKLYGPTARGTSFPIQRYYQIIKHPSSKFLF